jgi:hypothetical protein
MSQTPFRFISADQISNTVAAVLSEYFKSSERTIFWNDDTRRNEDPFEQLEGGFFAADWDFKVSLALSPLRVHRLIPYVTAQNLETVGGTTAYAQPYD